MRIINTTSKELYERVNQKLSDDGYPICKGNWDIYKENFCVRIGYNTDPKDVGWEEFSFYRRQQPHITIETAQEFLGERKEMPYFPMSYFTCFPSTYAFKVEDKPKKTKLMKLNNFMKKALSKDLQTLIKGGLVNGDLELTSEGRSAIWAELLEEKKAILVKLAEEKLKEEKEGKCGC